MDVVRLVTVSPSSRKSIVGRMESSTRETRARFWRWTDSIRHRARRQTDVLYAFYDLAVSPITYDAVKFVVLAEARRREVGCRHIHVVIPPGPDRGFREDQAEYYSYESMQWRLRNIVVPAFALMPTCQGVTVCATRKEALAIRASICESVFPPDYSARHPLSHYGEQFLNELVCRGVEIPSLESPPQALEWVSQWIRRHAGSRKIVTITLRQASHIPERNSNAESWMEFARGLNRDVYYPVFLPDNECAFAPIGDCNDEFPVFRETLWNLELRSAIYESSYLNMMINNGPAALCFFNRRVRYAYFKPVTPACESASEERWRSTGVEPGSQLQWAGPFQRIIWDDDSVDVLQREFERLVRDIESAAPATQPGAAFVESRIGNQ